MKDEIGTDSTVEVVEQLEDEQIDLEVVRWVAGEDGPPAAQRQWLEQLRREWGDSFCSDLIFALLGRRYPQPQADSMWEQIVSHRDQLTRVLDEIRASLWRRWTGRPTLWITRRRN